MTLSSSSAQAPSIIWLRYFKAFAIPVFELLALDDLVIQLRPSSFHHLVEIFQSLRERVLAERLLALLDTCAHQAGHICW